MTDPVIQQLYCTHCTFGTSALHRHTGNLKDEPFEYSTRAGSCSQSESHLKFQQIEKQYFYGLPLPSDATSDQRKRLTAATSAWRRLIAVPLQTGQLLSQVCYRTTDTSKPPRTGSYFAHVLLTESEQPAWTLTEALQMWGAGFWQSEDRADIDYDLKTVTRLKDLPGFQGVINDAALLSFLTTPVGGRFSDGDPGASRDEPAPRCAIPRRWRDMPVEDRQDWFAAVFQAVANLNLERRDRLLMAVEPSMAALVYYGVLRLLPLSGLVDQLSVSTFEPHADPTATVLTATDFADPRGAEQYLAGNRAIVINTYGKLASPVTRSAYFDRMLSRFLAEQGGREVDRIRVDLRSVGKSGLSSLRDCEQYFAAEDLVTRLLQPNPAKPVSEKEIAALKLDTARQKLRHALLSRLQAAPSNTSPWTELSQSVSRTMAILHLLAEEPELEGSAKVLARLCDGLPQNELPRFLDDPSVSSRVKLERLQREVVSTSQLPPGCESLWSPAKGTLSGDRPLLEQLVDKLDMIRLKMFCEKVLAAETNATSPRVQVLLTYLARATANNASKLSILTSYLSHEGRTEEQWDVLLGNPELRSVLFEVFPTGDPTLRLALINQLDRLLGCGNRFPTKLEILKGVESRIPDDRRAELSSWGRVRGRLKELNELQQQSAGILDLFGTGNRRRRYHELGASLGIEFQRILRATYGEQSATQQINQIKPFLRANSATGTLPEALTRGISDYLRGKDSTEAASTRKDQPSLAAKAISWSPIVLPPVLITSIALLVFRGAFFRTGDPGSTDGSGGKASSVANDGTTGGGQNDKDRTARRRAQDGNGTVPPSNSEGTALTHATAGNAGTSANAAAPVEMSGVSALEPANKERPEASEVPTVTTPDPVSTGSKSKAADWSPDNLYFADETEDPIKIEFASWSMTGPISFLTFHGPDVYRSKVGSFPVSDSQRWPLVVEWINDTTIAVSAPIPVGPTSSSELTRIWKIEVDSQLVRAMPPGRLDEQKKAAPEVFAKIKASLEACVLGIHYANGSKKFFALERSQSALPLKAEPQELLFRLGDPSRPSAKDKRAWALSSDAEMTMGGQSVYLGNGTAQSLSSGELELANWPETGLLRKAKLTVADGAALVSVSLAGEFVKVDNKFYEFHANQDSDPTSDTGKLKAALSEACKGFKQIIDDYDDLKRTFVNDTMYLAKQRRLERMKVLCEYFGEPAPIVRSLPAGTSVKPSDIADWVQSTNSEIDKLKMRISLERRNKEKNLLEALRSGIDQGTIVGTVYRVHVPANEMASAGKQSESTITRGIAVKVMEYKKPPKPEEAKDKKP